MDHTDYLFEVDEWLRKTRAKMRADKDFIGDHPYRHFDGRVSHQSLDTNNSKLVPFLKYPEKLPQYSFFPFIRKDKKVRRITRASIDQKVRPIMYAAHRDACIYAFYSYILKQKYEDRIKDTPLAESIIAYRHIDRPDGRGRGKCNIDFAKDIHEITKSHPRCAVLCLDISKFFDSMDHTLIKQRWIGLLGTDELPVGHYAVFRNVTRYRYVFLNEALVRLGYGKLKKGKFLYKRNVSRTGQLCRPAEFRAKIDSKQRSLVHKHRSVKGIPQGSPISDIIANMYLEDFDRDLLAKLEDYAFGHYRRYSDDILVICSEENAKEVYDFVQTRIAQEKLVIKPAKSEIVVLDNVNRQTIDITYSITGHDKHVSYAHQGFQYLGFELDTKDMHIRSGTVAAHYRRAKRRANAIAKASQQQPTTSKKRVSRRSKKNRSRWQYFISSKRRTGSKRIGTQYKKVLKRVRKFETPTS